MSRIVLSIATLFLLAVSSLARTPLQNLQVTLRGKKYEINDVSTVKDLKAKMKDETGISKEHHVLFEGKRLTPSTDLAEAGVEDGAKLNMVPVLQKKKNKEKSSVADGVRTTTSTESTDDTANAMKDYLEKSGVDTSKIDELMKQMGGGAGADGKMPDMKESLEMMGNMMNSPIFQQFMNDPEMLEQSRQMILNNPMLKSMMSGMPGMSEILDDPVAWKEAMQAAANLYKNMDPDQLKSMMGGAMPPGMGGMGGGLFDNNSAGASALDELDEE